MQRPRVSVITNVRNGAATLREAMDSVLAQTFTAWEYVVFDNASSDGSDAIIRSYTDPRVRSLGANPDLRLSEARAAAIAHAQGEWVAFLDHDDIWLHDKLEKQIAAAGTDPRVGIVYGRTLSFFENGVERDFDHRHEFSMLPEGDIFQRLFTDSCFISMSSVMIRKSALDELGPPPADIHICPDYYYYLYVARHYEARAVQEVVTRYRVHGAGLTGQRFSRIQEEVLWLIGRLKDRIEPALAQWRLRVHNTLIAYDELRTPGRRLRGLRRLFLAGSVPYLLSRPFARTWRALRRRVQTPYWKRASGTREISASPAEPVSATSATP